MADLPEVGRFRRSGAARARKLLRAVGLDRLIGADERPTDECWKRIEEGTLSSGERVIVALALELADFRMPAPPRVGALLMLDDRCLRAVAHALLDVVGDELVDLRRGGDGR